MPIPSTITPEDQARIEERKASKTEQASQLEESKQDTNDQIASAQEEEATNLKMWTFYHDDVISLYESERRWLDGQELVSPVVESDFTDRVNVVGRLYDASQAEPDIIRIDQFDGGPLASNSDHEGDTITQYPEPLDRLVNGLTTSNGSIKSTAEVISPLAIGDSVDVELDSVTGLTSGIEVIIYGGGLSFIATINNITSGGVCSDTQYTTELDCTDNGETWTDVYSVNITAVTPLSSSMPSAATLRGDWTGFTDTERGNKVPTVFPLQDVMDYYLGILSNVVSLHISHLNNQITPMLSNQDPSFASGDLTTTQSDLSSYTSYQSTLDISDTGLGVLSTLNTNRSNYLTTRQSTVNGQTSSYYDLRYQWAVERAGFNGTLIQIKGLEDSNETTDAQVNRLQDQVDLYNSEF